MIITLDAGHGRYDNQSENNPKYTEGKRMWEYQWFLKKELEKLGFTVFVTRPNLDDNPSLAERGKIAGKYRSDLLISLHSNSPARGTDGKYDATKTGVVTIYSLNREKTKKLADDVGIAVANEMGNNFWYSFTKQYPGVPDVDYYGVIRHSLQYGCKDAIIVEHGFHTNIHDSEWLLVDDNLSKMAVSEAKAVYQYYYGDKEEKPSESEKKVIYRVQTGAYSQKKYAIARKKELEKLGIDAFIVEVVI